MADTDLVETMRDRLERGPVDWDALSPQERAAVQALLDETRRALYDDGE